MESLETNDFFFTNNIMSTTMALKVKQEPKPSINE